MNSEVNLYLAINVEEISVFFMADVIYKCSLILVDLFIEIKSHKVE